MVIVSIEDSLHFPNRAVVITGECGHKHVRPMMQSARVGDHMYCLFCESAKPGTGGPGGPKLLTRAQVATELQRLIDMDYKDDWFPGAQRVMKQAIAYLRGA